MEIIYVLVLLRMTGTFSILLLHEHTSHILEKDLRYLHLGLSSDNCEYLVEMQFDYAISLLALRLLAFSLD